MTARSSGNGVSEVIGNHQRCGLVAVGAAGDGLFDFPRLAQCFEMEAEASLVAQRGGEALRVGEDRVGGTWAGGRSRNVVAFGGAFAECNEERLPLALVALCPLARRRSRDDFAYEEMRL